MMWKEKEDSSNDISGKLKMNLTEGPVDLIGRSMRLKWNLESNLTSLVLLHHLIHPQINFSKYFSTCWPLNWNLLIYMNWWSAVILLQIPLLTKSFNKCCQILSNKVWFGCWLWYGSNTWENTHCIIRSIMNHFDLIDTVYDFRILGSMRSTTHTLLGYWKHMTVSVKPLNIRNQSLTQGLFLRSLKQVSPPETIITTKQWYGQLSLGLQLPWVRWLRKQSKAFQDNSSTLDLSVWLQTRQGGIDGFSWWTPVEWKNKSTVAP